MFDKEKIEIVCLRCKYFRVIDTVTGKCKIDKATTKKLPIMKHEGSCDRWLDCGQQYFIRLGWVKKQKEVNEQ